MSVSVDVDIAITGPFFDGPPSDELARGMTAGMAAVGDEAIRVVQGELDAVLVNPTGRYRRRISYSLRQDDTVGFVGDNRALYGPWLSGSGSRNARSRFKGYAHWRLATQRLEQRAPAIAGEHVAKAVERLS